MPTTLDSNIPALIARLEKNAAGIVDDTLDDFERALLEEFQGPKTGIVYRRDGREHQASAPGEPPAIDTVDLASKIEPNKETPTRATMTSYSEHSAVMEYGGGHVAARPFWSVAVQTIRPAFDERCSKIWED